MRIAVIHNLNRGGALRRLQATASELHGEVQEFALSTATTFTRTPVLSAYRELANSSPRWYRPPLRYIDFVRLLSAWDRLARDVRAWAPDVIFANPCQFIQAPPILAECEAPVVYFCDEPRRATYDLAAMSQTNPATNALYALLRRGLASADRRAATAAHEVLANSDFAARRIHDAYGIESTVVELAVDPQFRPPSSPLPPRHLLTVGTLIPSKGHDIVLEAAALSGINLPVLLIAPRPNAQEESRLQRIATSLAVELEIRTCVTDEDLSHAYTRAFATLYLAHEEPLGLVSLESQASGTPVIVANEGGLAGTVVDGVTGIRVPRNASAAAFALQRLLRPGVRQQMLSALCSRPIPEWSDTARVVQQRLDWAAAAFKHVK